MGGAGVADEVERQAEARVQAGEPGEARRGQRHAVIAAIAGDDLALVRLAAGDVVVPHQLHLGVVGVRSGIAEEHLRHAGRRGAHDPLGEDRRRIRAHRREAVVVGQRHRLRADRVRDLRPAVADVDAPQPGHRVEVALARAVGQRDPLAAHDHRAAGALVLLQRGEGVEDVGPVEGGGVEVQRACHGGLRKRGGQAAARALARPKSDVEAGLAAEIEQVQAVRAQVEGHTLAGRQRNVGGDAGDERPRRGVEADDRLVAGRLDEPHGGDERPLAQEHVLRAHARAASRRRSPTGVVTASRPRRSGRPRSRRARRCSP